MNDEWKRLAHGLFGSASRLAVAAFFATVDDDEWVRQEDIRKGTGLLQAQVHRAMRELEGLGLLTVQRQGPLNWPHYKRVPTGLWADLAEVSARVSELAGSSGGATGDAAKLSP